VHPSFGIELPMHLQQKWHSKIYQLNPKVSQKHFRSKACLLVIEINSIVPQNSIPHVLVRGHEVITECKKKVHLIIDQWLSKEERLAIERRTVVYIHETDHAIAFTVNNT
jgi:hypothetical protein